MKQLAIKFSFKIRKTAGETSEMMKEGYQNKNATSPTGSKIEGKNGIVIDRMQMTELWK